MKDATLSVVPKEAMSLKAASLPDLCLYVSFPEWCMFINWEKCSWSLKFSVSCSFSDFTAYSLCSSEYLMSADARCSGSQCWYLPCELAGSVFSGSKWKLLGLQTAFERASRLSLEWKENASSLYVFVLMDSMWLRWSLFCCQSLAWYVPRLSFCLCLQFLCLTSVWLCCVVQEPAKKLKNRF